MTMMTNNKSAIEQYTTNLSKKIANKLDDYVVIGRKDETRKVIESLQRRTKNSPVLVGEPGVGKTAVVEGLAKQILENKVPERLLNTQIVSLNVASLQGENFSQNFERLLAELKEKRDKYILFIDEVHMIMGAGDSKGSLDMGNLLKPALSRGEFRVISATTSDEYHDFIEHDAALERRFQVVKVDEPNDIEAREIMMGLKPTFENYYDMHIDNEAIESSINISKRYINQHFLPDKAIDLVEGAAARLTLTNKKILETRDILDQVQEVTGIPTEQLSKSNIQRSLELSKTLNKRVLGQTRATNAISRRVQKVAVNHNDKKRPLAVEFLLGPTGTGKTELAKTMASVLFDDEDNMLRFDMSEYKDEHAVEKFIERATAGIIKNPYTIVLLDEVEKANPDVFDLLLQIFQDGILTNKRGKTAVFRNAYIILTSNEGFKFINDQMNYVGLPEGEFDSTNDSVMKGIKKELLNRFRPELINRIDDIVMFNQLNMNDVKAITRKRMQEYSEMVLKENGWKVIYDEKVIKYLAETAYEPENGARPIVRVIGNLIDSVISTQILNQQIENPNAKFIIKIDTIKNSSLGLEEDSLYDDRKLQFSMKPFI